MPAVNSRRVGALEVTRRYKGPTLIWELGGGDNTPDAFTLGADVVADPGASVPFSVIDVTGVDAGEDITASWLQGSIPFRVLDVEGGTELRAFGTASYTGPGRRIEFQSWAAPDTYDTGTTFEFDISGVSDTRSVTTSGITVIQSGSFTEIGDGGNPGDISVDRYGDGSVFVLVTLDQQSQLSTGPIFHPDDEPSMNVVGDVITIDPGYPVYGGSNPSLVVEVLDAGGEVLTSLNNSDSNLQYDKSSDIGELTVRIRAIDSINTTEVTFTAQGGGTAEWLAPDTTVSDGQVSYTSTGNTPPAPSVSVGDGQATYTSGS